MTNEHSRSARVLDPAYLVDLPARSLDQLHEMHAECLELETEVSYVRRIAQARIDILDAELDRRLAGGSLEELIRNLPRILADSGPRNSAATSHLPLRLAPEQDSEWALALAELESALVDLPGVDEDDLRVSADRLRTLERDVSSQRRELHAVIDHIDHELASRYRTG